jgi:hypothetical protein
MTVRIYYQVSHNKGNYTQQIQSPRPPSQGSQTSNTGFRSGDLGGGYCIGNLRTSILRKRRGISESVTTGGGGGGEADACRFGLNISTRISPNMMSNSKNMHFLLPVFSWYLQSTHDESINEKLQKQNKKQPTW